MPKRKGKDVEKGFSNDDKIPAPDLLAKYSTSKSSGLTSCKAAERFAHDGPNMLSIFRRPPSRTAKWGRVFLIAVLLLIWLGASCFLLLIKKNADLVTPSVVRNYAFNALIVVVILAVLLLLVMEIRSRVVPNINLAKFSSVTRNGESVQLPSDKLVSGDIVHLKSGNIVPADTRLLEATRFKVDNAPVERNGGGKPIVTNVGPVDAVNNLALMGAKVVEGVGVGVVIRTGDRTFIGRKFSPRPNPISKLLYIIGAVVALGYFVVTFVLGWHWFGGMVFALGLLFVFVALGRSYALARRAY